MRLSLAKLFTLLTVFSFNTLAIDCKFVSPEIDLPSNYSDNLELLEVATRALSYERDGMTIYTDLTDLQKVDRRKVKNSSSPEVLDAVGKIIVTYTDGTSKSTCTGTLVSTTPGQSSRIINSAGHCFGNTKTLVKSNIKDITWITTTKAGKRIEKKLTIEDLDLEKDEALLSFEGKIPFSVIKPALVENEITMSASDMIFYNKDAKIISAGYSSDNYKGKNGDVLTYDDEIKYKNFKADSLGDGANFSFETVVFSGASGGAILIQTDLSEEDIANPHNQYYLIGTILAVSEKGTKLYGTKDKATVGSANTVSRSYVTIDTRLMDNLNK